MEPFKTFTGIVAPLDRVNVDTDQIIPKQFLKRIERTGFGEFLFYDWRYLDDGKANPEFVLNKKCYRDATILLTRDNFGCGSSREHAPWALRDYGYRAIISRECYHLTIDLESQIIRDDEGCAILFEVDSFKKKCLIEGLDEIALTLLYEEK